MPSNHAKIPRTQRRVAANAVKAEIAATRRTMRSAIVNCATTLDRFFLADNAAEHARASVEAGKFGRVVAMAWPEPTYHPMGRATAHEHNQKRRLQRAKAPARAGDARAGYAGRRGLLHPHELGRLARPFRGPGWTTCISAGVRISEKLASARRSSSVGRREDLARSARRAIVCELVVVRQPLRLREEQRLLAEVDGASKRRHAQSRSAAEPQVGCRSGRHGEVSGVLRLAAGLPGNAAEPRAPTISPAAEREQKPGGRGAAAAR